MGLQEIEFETMLDVFLNYSYIQTKEQCRANEMRDTELAVFHAAKAQASRELALKVIKSLPKSDQQRYLQKFNERLERTYMVMTFHRELQEGG